MANSSGSITCSGHTEGLYEPIVHVPMIVHLPGGVEARREEAFPALVERVDIPPTIYDALGIEASGLELQGKSWLPIFKEPGARLRDYAYTSSSRNLALGKNEFDGSLDERIIRDDRWKLHFYLAARAITSSMTCCRIRRRRATSRTNIPRRRGELSFEMLRKLELIRTKTPGLPSGAQPIRTLPMADPDER